jgi:tetratricopeptide (TPR) repeat protein
MPKDPNAGPGRLGETLDLGEERSTPGEPQPSAFESTLQRVARAPVEEDVAPTEELVTPPEELGPGVVVAGRFEVVREIGRGGFARVFEARDHVLSRPVALKLLKRRRRLNDSELELFYREARATARLNHPNIVTAHDWGVWNDAPFLVLELLDGEPLQTYVARGPLTEQRAWQIATEVVHALVYAHSAGVLHLDLKSQNVFVLRDGRVKVLDFGMAGLDWNEDVPGQLARVAGGTPATMAPEQEQPGGVSTDARADIWAVGVVLHQMLFGRLPEKLAPDAERAPVPDGTSRPVEKVLARTLCREPQARYPDAGALLAALAEHPRPESRRRAVQAAARPRAPPLAVEGPLVGRTDELRQLIECYQIARGGQARVVIVEGEPGIGKTRLVAEFLAWAAAQDADTLVGRAFETGGRLPYQPLLDALRSRIEREEALDELLGDVWLVELSRLFVELRERYPDLPPTSPDEMTARSRLFEALARLGTALAARAPVVLLVDDLQWTDAASLDVLHYSAKRWTESGTAVLVLLAMRSEAEPSLVEWLAGLERDVKVTRLALRPLSYPDTLRFVSTLRDSNPGPPPEESALAELEELARWIFAETGGHPFFMAETLRALVGRGRLAGFDVAGATKELRDFVAPGVQQVISARLSRLSVAGRTLVCAGAVLGRAFTFEELSRVADLSEGEALPALDELLRAHLVRERPADVGAPTAYAFSHDKIRDVAYVEAGDARRRVFHRRALETLEGGAPAAELARHAVAAGRPEAAARFTLQAGNEAMRLLAARDAIVHYQRSVDLGLRVGADTLVGAARAGMAKALVSVGRWDEAKREFAAVLGTLPDEDSRKTELLLDSCGASFWSLDIPAVHRDAEKAASLAVRNQRRDLEITAKGWLAGAAGADGDLAAGSRKFDEAAALARDLGIKPPPFVFSLHGLFLYWAGRVEDAVERSRGGIEAARQANDVSALLFGLPHLGMSLAASGRYDAAAEVFDEVHRTGREYRIEGFLARAVSMSTGYRLDLFDFAGAEELSNEAREMGLAGPFLPAVTSANLDLLFNFVRRGDIGQADEWIDTVAASLEPVAGFHRWLWAGRLAQVRAELAAAKGQWDEALRASDEAIRQAQASQRVKYQALGLEVRARAHRGLGHDQLAIRDLNTGLALARTLGDPALFLRLATALLAFDGDEALEAEARLTMERVLAALPEGETRRAFLAAAPLRLLLARHAR